MGNLAQLLSRPAPAPAPAPAPVAGYFTPPAGSFLVNPGAPASGGFGATEAATALGNSLGGPLWGATFGSFTKKDPPFPVRLDPATGQAHVTTATGTPISAFARERFGVIETAFETTWSTGSIPSNAPKKYLPQLQLLLSQRGSYFGGSNMGGGIPPGGFAGFAQMTPASQLALGGRRTRGKKRRKSTKKAKRKTTKRKSKAARAGKKLIKGSKAAKARMAKLRRMRK